MEEPQTPQAAGPLSGLKVLDLSRVLAGPWASQILGDLGAEVWKIERPSAGDDTRTWGPPFLQGAAGVSDAAYYLCANRNKRSVAIDFAKPEGAEIVRRMAAEADIVVENFKTGALARQGLDYATLSALNPRLIYCSVTGFGHTGPYATRGGYDFLIQGMSGLMSVTGPSNGEPGAGPTKVGLPVSDLFTGLYAATSILAALHHRDKSGEGQHIDCALLDSQVAVLVNQGMNYLVGGKIPGRLGNTHPNVVPYRDFETSDGHVLVACGNDGQFQNLCRLLCLDEIADDPRFKKNDGRLKHRAELEAKLAQVIRTWTRDGFFAAMEEAGVPGGPINTIDQTLADPQIRARGMLQQMTRADGTPVTVIGYPGRLSRTPATYRIRAANAWGGYGSSPRGIRRGRRGAEAPARRGGDRWRPLNQPTAGGRSLRSCQSASHHASDSSVSMQSLKPACLILIVLSSDEVECVRENAKSANCQEPLTSLSSVTASRP